MLGALFNKFNKGQYANLIHVFGKRSKRKISEDSVTVEREYKDSGEKRKANGIICVWLQKQLRQQDRKTARDPRLRTWCYDPVGNEPRTVVRERKKPQESNYMELSTHLWRLFCFRGDNVVILIDANFIYYNQCYGYQDKFSSVCRALNAYEAVHTPGSKQVILFWMG